MRIVYLIRALAIHGGIERVVVDKMNFLAEQGHEVTLVTYEQGSHPCVFHLNSNIRMVELDCRFFTLYRYRLPIRLFKMRMMKRHFKERFHQLMKTLQPDTIVVISNSVDFIWQVLETPYGKKLLEAHEPYPAFMTSNHILDAYKMWSLRRAVRQLDAVLTLTNKDKPYWGKEVGKVLVVPNPVPFYCEQVDVFERKPGRILCVARLAQEKRIDRLIDAFALIANRYPSWYIDIYGDGVKFETLKKQISGLGLEGQIHFNPPTKQIKEEYQSSQFSVLCSDFEGFGLVIVESMACGTPVVSTDCAFGPSDIIKDGVDGLLCRLNVEDLAEKMEWMITHEKERRDMGIRAHQSVARYRRENIMKEWEKAYLSVI